MPDLLGVVVHVIHDAFEGSRRVGLRQLGVNRREFQDLVVGHLLDGVVAAAVEYFQQLRGDMLIVVEV